MKALAVLLVFSLLSFFYVRAQQTATGFPAFNGADLGVTYTPGETRF
jgi:hypothetical protein